MIELVAKQLFDGSARSKAAVRRQFTRAGLRKTRILIVPPAAPGSLGDEAMLSTLAQLLRSRAASVINILDEEFGPSWSYLEAFNRYLHWQGSRGTRRARRLCDLSAHDEVYLLGADVMDGYYSDAVSLSRASIAATGARVGAKVSFVGFSFNQTPKPKCVDALRALPATVRICARDPISHRRLEQHLQRPVTLTADIAFLLTPNGDTPTARTAIAWIKERQSQGRTVLGLNLSGHALQAEQGHDARTVLDVVACELTKLSREHGVNAVLIPHDLREEIGDLKLARELFDLLPADVRQHVKVVELATAAEVKAVCGALDAAVTARMHLAIACMGQGIPAAGIVYQGKFEGLFEHFGLDGLTLSPSMAFQRENFTRFVLELLARRSELKAKILDRLPAVRELAATNLMGS